MVLGMFKRSFKGLGNVWNILLNVWQHNRDLETHTLESLIYRLRKKIEKNPNKPKILINDENKYLVKI